MENSEAPTVDPSKITKVPIQIVQCEKDSALPNEGIEDLMGDSVQLWTTVPEVDNPWFETMTASDEFYTMMKSQIEYEPVEPGTAAGSLGLSLASIAVAVISVMA